MDSDFLSNWNLYWQSYLNLNPDLRSAGINDKQTSKNHYMRWGRNEKRQVINKEDVNNKVVNNKVVNDNVVNNKVVNNKVVNNKVVINENSYSSNENSYSSNEKNNFLLNDNMFIVGLLQKN